MNEETKEQEINLDDKQLARGNEFLHALEPYGQVKVVREMARRIQALDTSDTPLNGGEAAHLAQLAVAHDLNPFSGEIWAWIQVKGDRRHFNWMPGRSGITRHANQQAKEGEYEWWTDERPLTEHEKTSLFIPKDALAFESSCFDSLTMGVWNENFTPLREDLGAEEALKILGKPPCSTGVGVLTKQEIDRLPKNNKMPHVNRCKKRARNEAIKNKFSLSFGGSAGGAGVTFDEYIHDEKGGFDVEFAEVETPWGLDPESHGGKERLNPKSWGKIPAQMVEAGLARDDFVAAEILAYTPLPIHKLSKKLATDLFTHAKAIHLEDETVPLNIVAEKAYGMLFGIAQEEDIVEEEETKKETKKEPPKKPEVQVDDAGLNKSQKESLGVMAKDYARYTPKHNQDWETAYKYIDLKKVSTSRKEFQDIVNLMGGDVRLGMCRMLGYL